MAKVREILGQVSVETAKGKRICHRNRRSRVITEGDLCLVIREPTKGGRKNYYRECAETILERAAADLAELRCGLQRGGAA